MGRKTSTIVENSCLERESGKSTVAVLDGVYHLGRTLGMNRPNNGVRNRESGSFDGGPSDTAEVGCWGGGGDIVFNQEGRG